MRSGLPRLPRRRSRWQRIGLGTAQFVGVKALQGVAGIALGFAGIAVADTVTDSPTLHTLVALGFIVLAALVARGAWVAGSKKRRNNRHPSTHQQVRNRWTGALSRRFRRG